MRERRLTGIGQRPATEEVPMSDKTAPPVRCTERMDGAAPETCEQRCPTCLGKGYDSQKFVTQGRFVNCRKCKGTGVLVAPSIDLKLRDSGVRRGSCVVGGKAAAEAATVTHGAVLCSAWLGVAVNWNKRLIR